VDDFGHAPSYYKLPGFFACGERTNNTPLYPKTSRALLSSLDFSPVAKDPKNTPLYPKTSRALLPQRCVFFNACTFVQAQVRH